MHEILQCPFCGSARTRTQSPVEYKVVGELPAYVKMDNAFFVTCDNCKAEGPVYRLELEAIESWNKVQRIINSAWALSRILEGDE